MFVQLRTMIVKPGDSGEVVERFGKPGIIEESEGFIDLSVLTKKAKRSDEHEEVVILIRRESEDAWKNWEKSDAHIQGHRNNRGQPQPDYLIGSSHASYEVKASKDYRPAAH